MSESSNNAQPAQGARPVQHRPSLIVNAMSNWAALGANMIVGFVITPFILLHLGKNDFGIYDLVLVIVGYSGLLDLGITSAIMRYAALYAGRRDHKSLSEVASTALVVFSSIGLFVFLCCFALSSPIADFFKVKAENKAVFEAVVSLLGLSAGLTFPSLMLSVLVLAHERYVLANSLHVLAAIYRGIAAYTVLKMGGGLVSLSWVNVSVSLLNMLLNLSMVVFFLHGVRLSFRSVKLSRARSLFTFGVFTFINKIGDVLRFRMGQAVIGRFMTLGDAALYALGAMVFKNVFRLSITAGGPTHPRLSALAGKDDLTEFRNSYLYYSSVVAVFSAIVGTTAFLLAPDFLRIWIPLTPDIDAADVRQATLVFLILVTGLLPDVMTSITSNALQAVKKHRYLAYQTAAEGVVNLSLSVFLISRYHSILYVALAAAIPALITKVIIQPIYSTRILGVSWKTYFYTVLFKPLGVMALVALTLRSVEVYFGSAFEAHSYLMLAVKGAIVLTIVAGAACAFCFDPKFLRVVMFRLSSMPMLSWMRVRYSAQG